MMTVSEAQLMRLSKRLPHKKYTDFCNQLGIQYNEAMNILARFSNNYTQAYKQVLMDWRDRTGGIKDRLIAALEAADIIGGLVYDKLLNGADINLQSLTNQIQRLKKIFLTGFSNNHHRQAYKQARPRGIEELPNMREQGSLDSKIWEQSALMVVLVNFHNE